MVKLQFRVIENSYKNGQRIYFHGEVTLNFPKDLHEILGFLRYKKLEVKGYREGKKVHIIIGDKEDP